MNPFVKERLLKQKLAHYLRRWYDNSARGTYAEMISVPRKTKIEKVLNQRTYSVLPVLDQICDLGNINAVVRSAEALGFQKLHVIKSASGFKHSKRTTQGALNWVDIELWDASDTCLLDLKRQGYRILGTRLENAKGISEVDFTYPTAIVFGNEKEGIGGNSAALADEFCKLPMLGFTESYNISVAAALSFYHIYQDRIYRQGYHGDLTAAEKEKLRSRFYQRATRLGKSVTGSL